ncbi:transporter [Rhodoblastus acidophilus]|uniref:Transporter n=1 Tax=Rhodoblastus acidophilus TaxID=1074 RepID=A0A6N8DTB5_RHOAC|nr:transporter [Rhodoblastus acidophilus]MCW2275830.1 hypothetical protein [Rhodoblastus acidophilus]MTV32433.1 transporter [Rhodoblastus acidophilus]
MKRILLSALILGLTAQPGRAEDAAPAPDKSGYTLFNPTPPDAMRPFTPEMPTKILNPFTVDAGHVQIDGDLVNYAHTNMGDLRAQGFQITDAVYKLGLTSSLDFEISPNGYQTFEARDRRAGALSDRAYGFGDLVLKAKLNLVGNEGGDFALALVPYVKLPTAARGLGNGATEAALAVPAQFNLPSDFTLAVQTEIDALKRTEAPGYFTSFVNLVNLGHPLPFISKDLSAAIELYSAVGTDRAAPPVYTFDVGLAYLLAANVQLDAGANFGLNKYAPNLNVYAGGTVRY